MLTIGVDVGGTFTDFAVHDEETGRVRTHKTPSTYPDPLAGVVNGIKDLGIDLREVRWFMHGTTVGTNAVIQRRGAKTAFITTAGFRDHIEIGDNRRFTGGLFDPQWERTRPLVPLPLRLEVRERVLADGQVLTPLHEEDVLRIIEELKRQNIEAAAVGFINSYVNDTHEQRVGELLRTHLPGVPYTLSSEAVREFREFPRFSTTVMNAYLLKLLGTYVEELGKSLQDFGYSGKTYYMSSIAGLLTEEIAMAQPVRLVLSGPAAGVVGAGYLGQALGVQNLITYDMGGTSTDVCLIKDLSPEVSTKRVFLAYPVMIPMLDVNTVGAGGGSIIWVDRTGALRVGPQSAGASPGPACYGQGGDELTITDANLILGRISPRGLLGGEVPLRLDLAEQAARRVCEKVNIPDVHRLAEGAIRIAVSNMSGAIRGISIEKGHDPREFTLAAFGGAGPMHAIPIAEELGIPTVVIPREPGNFCAAGLLASDLRHDYVSTYLTELDKADLARIRETLRQMDDQGRQILLRDGVSAPQIHVQNILSLRYVGQSWEIDIPVDSDRLAVSEVAEAFDEAHLKAYGYNRRGHPLELVNLRVVAIGQFERPALVQGTGASGTPAAALAGHRKVYVGGDAVDCPVYDRAVLAPQASLTGPALIEEFGSNTIVFPGWKVTVDRLGSLVLERTDPLT